MVIARAGAIVRDTALGVDAPTVSLTRTVKSKVPEAVGVPLNTPAPLTLSPFGGVPVMTVQVCVPVPRQTD